MSVPAAVQRIRADICSRCPMPCEHQQNPEWHATACAVCPRSHDEYPQRWHTWGACDESAPPAELRGLGDAVAVVAQPIARMIDAATASVGINTNVQGCGGCNKRQADWNQAVPFRSSGKR